jgi:hypothetical protein
VYIEDRNEALKTNDVSSEVKYNKQRMIEKGIPMIAGELFAEMFVCNKIKSILNNFTWILSQQNSTQVKEGGCVDEHLYPNMFAHVLHVGMRILA